MPVRLMVLSKDQKALAHTGERALGLEVSKAAFRSNLPTPSLTPETTAECHPESHKSGHMQRLQAAQSKLPQRGSLVDAVGGAGQEEIFCFSKQLY